MSIPLPRPNTTGEVVARAASKCVRLACLRHFPSVPLGELGQIISGGTPSTSNPAFWDGDVLWVTPKDLGKPRTIEIESSERTLTSAGLQSSSARLLPAGSVLLSSRAPIGHIGIAARPLATNQGFKNIICSEKLNNRFLFHWLRSQIEELQQQGRGNTFLEIPSRVVAHTPVALVPLSIQHAAADFLDCLYRKLSGEPVDLPMLPTPLEEQRRLVERIDTLALAIDKTLTLRSEATEEVEKLVASKACRAMAEADPIRGRALSILKDICEIITDGAHNTPSYVDDGVPLLTAKNVFWDRIETTNVRHISRDEHEPIYRRCPVKRGDVLLINIGATTGTAAQVEFDTEVSVKNVAMLRVRPRLLTADFLVYLLRYGTLRVQIASLQAQTCQQFLTLRDIRNLTLAIPPLSFQHRTVSALNALRSEAGTMRRLQTESAEELNALLPSILDRAFRGEL